MNSIDFLIPARKEPSTIGPLIQAILDETIEDARKRIVVATGDDKETEGKVEGFRNRYPEEITHIKNVASNGKARALNSLLREVRAPVVIFADADIKVEKGTFRALYEDIVEHKDVAASVACVLPYDEQHRFPLNYFSRIYATRLPLRMAQYKYISGRLFAIKRDFLPDKLPTNVMDEDRYISLVVPYHKIRMNVEAIAYFHYFQNMRDYCVFQYRGGYTKRQLEEFYPDLVRKRESQFNQARVAELDDTTVNVERQLVETMGGTERLVHFIERKLAKICDDVGWYRASMDHTFKNPRFWDCKRPNAASTKGEF